jgi:hypothetical protein
MENFTTLRFQAFSEAFDDSQASKSGSIFGRESASSDD